MTRRLRLSGLAAEELTYAVRWYEQQRPGLGGRFFDAVTTSLARIRAHSALGSPANDDRVLRSFSVTGLPYRIVYRVVGDDIRVLAFAHARRRPSFWKDRT